MQPAHEIDIFPPCHHPVLPRHDGRPSPRAMVGIYVADLPDTLYNNLSMRRCKCGSSRDNMRASSTLLYITSLPLSQLLRCRGPFSFFQLGQRF